MSHFQSGYQKINGATNVCREETNGGRNGRVRRKERIGKEKERQGRLQWQVQGQKDYKERKKQGHEEK